MSKAAPSSSREQRSTLDDSLVRLMLVGGMELFAGLGLFGLEAHGSLSDEQDIDPEVQAKVDDMYVRMGVRSPKDIADDHGGSRDTHGTSRRPLPACTRVHVAPDVP